MELGIKKRERERKKIVHIDHILRDDDDVAAGAVFVAKNLKMIIRVN